MSLKNSFGVSRSKKLSERKKMTDDLKLDDKSVWTNAGNTYTPSHRIIEDIPAGSYDCYLSMQGDKIFEKKEMVFDENVRIKESTFHDILEEIQKFWTLADRFSSRGFVHKRGFLLVGPPGCGKTTVINTVSSTLINENNGIVVFLKQPEATSMCLSDLRILEPKRPILVVIEDIDGVIDEYGDKGLLALLDGDSQIDNIIFIATSNYPEKLQDRIIKRPSRFDTIKYMDTPNANVRKQFFEKKEPSLSEDELNDWVDVSDGLSFAHMKEMIIMNKCFDIPIEDAVHKLKEYDVMDEKDKNRKNKIGFVT